MLLQKVKYDSIIAQSGEWASTVAYAVVPCRIEN